MSWCEKNGSRTDGLSAYRRMQTVFVGDSTVPAVIGNKRESRDKKLFNESK